MIVLPLIIRRYELRDYWDLLEIEKEAFPTHNPARELMMYLTYSSDVLVADLGGKVVGYIAISELGRDAKIISFAVKKEFRRKGIGTKLLDTAINICKEKGKEKLFLEVRVSNIPAQSLYKKKGFKVVKIIPNYYSDGESAYLMVLDLSTNNV